ncbi:NAD(P)/FAD-dependent oxidoreductase [Kiloniella laminariae]|uniref:Pyridine nucleotide-disulfide oxidoreductase domain-containing protein 2 n=1 Tax=Kiloniella laminariae TaxID=454162 RepID=A0ABT4LN51_9PROT|nr:NAD(P)/FAD-dependent oxidoreductase [Kiloniella laminariae]MCZ4282563.1 NAD(P)/FAD-dependent oxidoreductase [Kiloniella laminariae]
MSETFDAVFIGAGHNSLACAAHLATKGWSVGIFEQAPTAGGAVKTDEYTAPGFKSDWAAMNLSLFAGSPFFSAYKQDLLDCGLEFIPVKNCFSSAFPDGSWLGVTTDLSETLSRISAFSPEDAKTWNSLVKEFPKESETLFSLLSCPINLNALACLLTKIVFRKGPSGTKELFQFLLSSSRVWLDTTFQSEHLKATLAAWGMHLDFAPDIAGGALFPYLEAMANQSFGMVIGKGGAATLTNALTTMVQSRGGKIECNAPVLRIQRDNKGKATAIELDNGRVITAKRAVIANVAPGALIEKLLDRTSGHKKYDSKMRGFSHAPGTMMIHLAVDNLPNWTASPDLQKFAYVHLAPSMDQMARTYQQAKAGLLPDEPVIVVGQPTTVDPSRAPEGKHVLWIQVRMVPADIKGDAKGEITGRSWGETVTPYTKRVLDIIENYAPGFKASILHKRTVTPLELEQENPNLVGGDQVCGSHHLHQHFLFRPAASHASGETPVKNLHLIGAATWPGAGLGAGSGFALGQKLAGK